MPPISRANSTQVCSMTVGSGSPVYLRKTRDAEGWHRCGNDRRAWRIGAHVAMDDRRGRAAISRRVVAAQLFWKATSRRPRSSTTFQPRFAAWNGSGACMMATSTRCSSSSRSSRGPVGADDDDLGIRCDVPAPALERHDDRALVGVVARDDAPALAAQLLPRREAGPRRDLLGAAADRGGDDRRRRRDGAGWPGSAPAPTELVKSASPAISACSERGWPGQETSSGSRPCSRK